MRLSAKLIQAVTVGALATLGAQLAIFVAGSRGSFLPGLALSVGVPSAIAAMVFFQSRPRHWRADGPSFAFLAQPVMKAAARPT